MDPAKRAEIDARLLDKKIIDLIQQHYWDQQWYGLLTPKEHYSLRDQALARFGLVEAFERHKQDVKETERYLHESR